jgi:hypothetical protein
MRHAVANPDIATSLLQELREQTLNCMSQLVTISAKSMLGLLKSYDSNLNTSVVTEEFRCSAEEVPKIMKSVETSIPPFITSLGLSLSDDESEQSPSDQTLLKTFKY